MYIYIYIQCVCVIVGLFPSAQPTRFMIQTHLVYLPPHWDPILRFQPEVHQEAKCSSKTFLGETGISDISTKHNETKSQDWAIELQIGQVCPMKNLSVHSDVICFIWVLKPIKSHRNYKWKLCFPPSRHRKGTVDCQGCVSPSAPPESRSAMQSGRRVPATKDVP